MNKFQYCFFNLSLSCYKEVFRKHIVCNSCTHTSNCEQFCHGQANISLYDWLINIITDNSYLCRLWHIQLCLPFWAYQKWPGLSIFTYSFKVKDNFFADHGICHTFWVMNSELTTKEQFWLFCYRATGSYVGFANSFFCRLELSHCVV